MIYALLVVDRVLYCSCYIVVLLADVVIVVIVVFVVVVCVVVMYSRHCFHVRLRVHIETLSIKK